jgi:hypothetical protein
MLSKNFKRSVAALALAGSAAAMGTLAAPAAAQAGGNNNEALQQCASDINNPNIKMETYITGRGGAGYIHTKFGFDRAANGYTGCIYTNQTNEPERVSGAKDLTIPQQSRQFYETLDAARLADQNLRGQQQRQPVVRGQADNHRDDAQTARDIERQRRLDEQERRRAEQEYRRQIQQQQQQERRCEQAQLRLAQATERAGINIFGNGRNNMNRAASQAIQIRNLQNEVQRQCAPLHP